MEPEEEIPFDDLLKRARKISGAKKAADEGRIVDDEKKPERDWEILSYHDTPWGH